jgi:hypothetical protein
MRGSWPLTGKRLRNSEREPYGSVPDRELSASAAVRGRIEVLAAAFFRS